MLIGEGIFGALTVDFGGWSEGGGSENKNNLRIIICCLKIVVR
jgi:hypothetical protein